jgi:hypothetical protein
MEEAFNKNLHNVLDLPARIGVLGESLKHCNLMYAAKTSRH